MTVPSRAPPQPQNKPGLWQRDVLSDVLGGLKLEGGIFLDAELSPPWAVRIPSGDRVAQVLAPGVARLLPFHLLTEGSCRFEVDGAEPIRAAAGDVIVLPAGPPHVMASGARVPPVPSERLLAGLRSGALAAIVHGGGGRAVTRVVCGFVGIDDARTTPLLAALPPVFRVPVGDGLAASWIKAVIGRARSEANQLGPGSAATLAKLAELLFIEAVRLHLDAGGPARARWLAGLREPQLARALSLLHGDPRHGWTVAELARRTGLSRSALTERFRRFLAVPPMRYLSSWRLQQAAELLARGDHSVAQVAAAVGFASEAAFSRAFRRGLGVPPSRFGQTRSSTRTPRG